MQQLLTHGLTSQLGAAFCHQIAGTEAICQYLVHSRFQGIGCRPLLQAMRSIMAADSTMAIGLALS